MSQKQPKPTLSGQRIRTRKRDEKEKQDPLAFRDAIIQGLQEIANNDLDQVLKFLVSSGSKLNFRLYGEYLFDILFAGGVLAPGGSILEEGEKSTWKTSVCVFEANDEDLKNYVQVINQVIARYRYLQKAFEDEIKKILLFLKGFTDDQRNKLAIVTGIILANGIKEAIVNSCDNITQWEKKVVAFGADGASVNLGKKGGVAALMRKEIPYLVDFHCLPHRLELALLEMQKSCKSVQELYEVMNLVWKTYHYSAKSSRELKALASELGVDAVKPTQVSGTRWLPHVSRALKVFIKSGDAKKSEESTGQYALVLCHMEHLSTSSSSADIKGRAKSIVKRMRDVQFAAFCHFLADMFSILGKLSLKMQSDDLILPVAVSQLKETVAAITCLKSRHVPNGYVEKFLKVSSKSSNKDTKLFQGIKLEGSLAGKVKRIGSGPSFNSEVNKAVDLCLDGLKERFGQLMDSPDSSDSHSPYGPQNVIQDFLVFNVDSWPHKDAELIDFGNDNIKRLINWFEPALRTAGCEVDDILPQWQSMKITFNSQFRDKDYNSLWKMFLSKEPYKSDLKDILHLVEILLVLPISAAGCERMVSSQNRIKSSLRASLKTSSLEGLIRISAQGPSLEEFDPLPSVNRWFARDRSKGERQRRPNFSR